MSLLLILLIAFVHSALATENDTSDSKSSTGGMIVYVRHSQQPSPAVFEVEPDATVGHLKEMIADACSFGIPSALQSLSHAGQELKSDDEMLADTVHHITGGLDANIGGVEMWVQKRAASAAMHLHWDMDEERVR